MCLHIKEYNMQGRKYKVVAESKKKSSVSYVLGDFDVDLICPMDPYFMHISLFIINSSSHSRISGSGLYSFMDYLVWQEFHI